MALPPISGSQTLKRTSRYRTACFISPRPRESRSLKTARWGNSFISRSRPYRGLRGYTRIYGLALLLYYDVPFEAGSWLPPSCLCVFVSPWWVFALVARCVSSLACCWRRFGQARYSEKIILEPQYFRRRHVLLKAGLSAP